MSALQSTLQAQSQIMVNDPLKRTAHPAGTLCGTPINQGTDRTPWHGPHLLLFQKHFGLVAASPFAA
jgi:hypothetical protein